MSHKEVEFKYSLIQIEEFGNCAVYTDIGECTNESICSDLMIRALSAPHCTNRIRLFVRPYSESSKTIATGLVTLIQTYIADRKKKKNTRQGTEGVSVKFENQVIPALQSYKCERLLRFLFPDTHRSVRVGSSVGH